jgi:hypothetical protein
LTQIKAPARQNDTISQPADRTLIDVAAAFSASRLAPLDRSQCARDASVLTMRIAWSEDGRTCVAAAVLSLVAAMPK